MEASSTETKANNVFVAPVSENDEERLLKIAIIYGVNASGKTNIIRMLYALRSMISNMTANQGGEGIYLYEPFVLDEDSKNEPTEISISFIVNNIKHLYELTYNGEEFLSEKLTYFPKGVAAILFERVPVENDSIIKVYEPKYFTSIPKSNVQKFVVFSYKLIISKFLINKT